MPAAPPPSEPVAIAPRAIRPGALLLTLLFGLLVFPVILTGGGGTNEHHDQVRHHEPFIRALIDDFPRMDLAQYSTATTPGYHLLLAGAARFIRDDARLLQSIGALFGLALVLALYRRIAPLTGATTAVILALPLLLSSYVLGASIWLTTDNAGWLFASLAIAAILFPATTAQGAPVLRASSLVLAAVLVRQVHLWAAGPVAVCILSGTALARCLPGPLRFVQAPPVPRRRLVAALGVLLASVAVVAGFAAWWGGLVPPRYQGMHASSVNPAAIPLALALFGGFGAPMLPLILRRRPTRADLALALAAAGAAILLCLVIPTAPDADAGRRGAIWTVAARFPVVAYVSLLMLPLVIAGAVTVVLGVRRVMEISGPRPAFVMTLSLAAWLAAQCANAQAWQRYAEPMVLIVLAWIVALSSGGRGQAPADDAARGGPAPRPTALCLAGPLGVALLQAVIAALTLYRVVWQAAG